MRPVLKLFVCLIVMLITASAADGALPQDAAALGTRFFSVKITQNDRPLMMPIIFNDTADNLIVQGASLETVISRAYGLQSYQIVDTPEWVRTSHLYDIEAVPPPATLVESDVTQMLKSMLADRFNLQTQLATRDVTIWVLAADAGTTLEEDLSDAKMVAMNAANPRTVVIRRRLSPDAAGPFTANMNWLAGELARSIGQPVLNLTALPSLYVMNIPRLETRDPAIFADFLRTHAGLVFELRTIPMEVLVVTAIDHPRLDTIDL